MTCHECEFGLAQGEPLAEIGEHLIECAHCRAFKEELAANFAVLESLRDQEMPSIAVKAPQRRWLYGVAAAAAALLVAIPAVHRSPGTAATQPVSHAVAASPQLLSPQLPSSKGEPLKIKMLTPDPDVVVYWLIDN